MYLSLASHLFGHFLENLQLKYKSTRPKNLKFGFDVLTELYLVYWLWFLFYVHEDVYELEHVILERLASFKQVSLIRIVQLYFWISVLSAFKC